MRNHASALIIVICGLLLASCSDTTVKETSNKDTAKTTEKAPAPAPEPITGRRAFQQVYPMARTWAADAQPVRIQSMNIPQVKSTEGKCGAWEVVFFSPTSGKGKSYTWSAVEAGGNLHEGVFAGSEESIGSAKPFLVAAIQKDSDDAYKAAVEHSADYVKKNADKPIIYILEMTNRYPQLVWRVVWGDSVGTSDYSVFVDAATGQFLGKVH